MLTKRIIPCLDVKHGRVTKGVRFAQNRDIGDPVELARKYYRDGADELVFYDIGASPEDKGILIDWVQNVAKAIHIPFAVGGGIRSVTDMRAVLLAGAEKVSINSAAVLNPQLIADGAKAFGAQCVVLGVDVKRVTASASVPSGFEVYIHGGRKPMYLDALGWIQRAAELGAGEVCVNSIDADGTKAGYDLDLLELVVDAVGIPVIASGGAGSIEDIISVFRQAHVDAALVASIVHEGTVTMGEIKRKLGEEGFLVRN